ncbi:G-protein coupled receptor family C group 5 member C isoform X2 [Neoarius graeffei]|uniref:G-protein coupled receptor family C group 5 member C isoform X2 n=1 Tax=Neoarius graeffei TaxID=443677 RepID=UPI00298CD434|nr:G-protein coupled receptor family C group 5 member C isoform X2 [Neoarius graeffei]
MDYFAIRPFWNLVLALVVALVPGSTGAPQGCGSNVSALYYNLCDLGVVWGIVVEAFAAAGVLLCLILLMVVLANLPFMSDKRRSRSVPLDVGLLVGTLGLFGLTFAFIVDKDFATCSSRRFLFGVLYAACFSCLLMKAINLNILSRHNKGPRSWALCLGALAFWLVEVIINVEWLIITLVRQSISQPTNQSVTPEPCSIANEDFVMALIYVMALLVAVCVVSTAVLCGKHRRWHKDGVFIMLTGIFSLGIWVAWIVMYTYGNNKHGNAKWDDPTLAIALVANAWTFLLLYAVPELCQATHDSEAESALPADVYSNHAVGYENILKDQSSQNMFMENKAFTMDEPKAGNKPVSPYSGYNGQLRSPVYQPTELAIITKGITNDCLYDTSIPRASLATSPSPSGSIGPTLSNTGQDLVTNGNGLHWKSQW